MGVFDQASLPPSTYPAFKEAIEALREGGFMIEPGGAARLKRRTIERVLTRCENEDIGDLAPLLTLLRRFATEAAREEARLFCDELVAESFEDSPRRPNRGLVARRKNAFQVIWPVGVLGAQNSSVTSFSRWVRELGDGLEVGPGIFARDGPHGIYMLLDERERYTGPVGRVFDKAA